MIIGTISQKAEMGGQRYGWFTMGLSGLFNRGLGVDGGGLSRLIEEARELAHTYLITEANIIDAELSEIALEARRATLSEIRSNDTENLTVAAGEHLSASSAYVHDELHAQVSRDIATLRKSIQRANLEVGLVATTRNQSLRSVALERAIQSNAGPDFVFHDRASRKWSSKTFVRTTWRHTLLSVYNEVVLLTLADHGIDRAQVIHEDPANEHHQAIVTIDEIDGFDSYGEIRDVIFHPNAHAVLRMEQPYVSA